MLFLARSSFLSFSFSIPSLSLAFFFLILSLSPLSTLSYTIFSPPFNPWRDLFFFFLIYPVLSISSSFYRGGSHEVWHWFEAPAPPIPYFLCLQSPPGILCIPSWNKLDCAIWYMNKLWENRNTTLTLNLFLSHRIFAFYLFLLPSFSLQHEWALLFFFFSFLVFPSLSVTASSTPGIKYCVSVESIKRNNRGGINSGLKDHQSKRQCNKISRPSWALAGCLSQKEVKDEWRKRHLLRETF